MTNSELKERLTGAIALLKIPGVGRVSYKKLVKKFGSPEGVFKASIDEISLVDRISRGIASGIKRECDLPEAGQIASKIVQLGWQVMFLGDENYPEQLKSIPAPPPLLFATGQKLGTDEKLIAIVGTRHATEAGELFTYRLATELVNEGITVVSGMADGIDSAAHKGALDAGGKTIAVWGSSLDIVFPASFSSGPSTSKISSVPISAASIITPMMDLPLTLIESLLMKNWDSNFVAVVTNRAAGRA